MPSNIKAKDNDLPAHSGLSSGSKTGKAGKSAKSTPVKKTVIKKAVTKSVTPVKKETIQAEVVTKPASTKSVKADVFDITGKIAESVSLPGMIFAAKINPDLMAQAVRIYLANQRQGNASTKTRGEVAGSTRKIYRQKGTGRARHGGVRAPIFVKGGIAHGPKPKDYTLKLSKKMRKASLFSALTTKLQDNQVKIVAGLEKLPPKTKDMVALLQKLTLDTKKQRVLLVLSANQEKNQSVIKISRNIDGVTYLSATQLNTYDVLHSAVLLFAKDAVVSMEQHFLRKDTN